MDLEDRYKDAYTQAYAELSKAAPGLKILLTTYFDSLRGNADLAFGLPVDGVHVDLCRGPGQANTAANDAKALLDEALNKVGDKVLSVGVIDGRNIWRNDLTESLNFVEVAVEKLGKDKVFVAPSCSLLHTPVDLNSETELDAELRNWMAFATQKLDEIATLAKGANEGPEAIADELEASDNAQEERRSSERIHNQDVKSRASGITAEMKSRKSPFSTRQKVQRAALDLPAYPTTSIGHSPRLRIFVRPVLPSKKVKLARRNTKRR